MEVSYLFSSFIVIYTEQLQVFYNSSLQPARNSTYLPVPIATQVIGSSAVIVLIPVLEEIKSSRPRKRLPPPVNTIPLSAISAANSGGVFSKTL